MELLVAVWPSEMVDPNGDWLRVAAVAESKRRPEIVDHEDVLFEQGCCHLGGERPIAGTRC